ncbi:MAG: hypothetical protein ABFS37_02120 [Acidobacteriota bacterium]
MKRYRHQPTRGLCSSEPPKTFVQPVWLQGACAFALVLVLLYGGSGFALTSEPVQVGARGNILQTDLDFHSASGHLFAVLLNEESGQWAWLVNISTDNGETWTETYEWPSTMAIADISSVVAGDYLYVAYVDPLVPEFGKIRRFNAIDGSVDSTYGGIGWIEVLDAGTDTFREVAVASSADQNDTRLYYFAIQSNYVLRYAWTNQEGGADTPWSEIDTGVTSANHAIDATYAENSSTFLYVAYEGLDGDLHIWRRMSDVTSDVTDFGVIQRDWLRISAFEDTIVALYDDQVAADRGLKYLMSTDAGDTWQSPSPLTPMDNYTSPAVTLRNGGGVAAVYHDVTTPDWAALTQKDYANGDWSTPVDCATPGLTTGSYSDIEWLPFGNYGVLLVGSGTSGRNSFFALPLLLFGDGFESGDDTQWSETLPLQ